MTIHHAKWETTQKPKDSLGLFFTELAGWTGPGHLIYRILLASNGKLYRVAYKMRDDEKPDQWHWEGYTV